MTNNELDVTAIVRRFGGRAQLYRKLCLAKVEISHRTIDNWIYHGMVPMNRFLELIALAKAEGFKLNLADYIKNEHSRTVRTAIGGGDRKVEVNSAVPETSNSAR